MGIYDKAIEEYNKAIELEPLFAAAFKGLGASYGELGEFGKAVEAYLEATHLGPNYAQAQYGLGWSYFQLKEYNKALLPLKIAVKIEPKMVAAHFTSLKAPSATAVDISYSPKYKIFCASSSPSPLKLFVPAPSFSGTAFLSKYV